MHARDLSRNIHVNYSFSIGACASAIILSCTSVCLFVHARASASICVSGGCLAYLSVVMSSTLLRGNHGHGSRTDNVYIRGDIGDYL